MLHYNNRRNNPGHHDHCLHGSESVSICSFCCPKGLVRFVLTNGTMGFPLALLTTYLQGWPCQVELLHLDQKPASSPGDVLRFSQCSFLLSLADAFCTPQSKVLHLPQVQTDCVPWPNQQRLQKNFCKIWELGNTCELHCSKRRYKNVMQPQCFMKSPAWIFEVLLICNSFSFQGKKNWNSSFVFPFYMETILNWGVWVCLLSFWRVRGFIYKKIKATALFLTPLLNTHHVL